MTKRQRIISLEERIGQLEVHIRKDCLLRAIGEDEVEDLEDKDLDGLIAERVAWLRENGEKKRMGGGY
jgi:hypothetical protein